MAVVGVVIGVPAVLVVTARWPLPTKSPNWDNVYWAIRQGNIPAEGVVKALACVVWLAWAQIMWALLWTLCVNVPRLLHGRAEVPVPLAAAPASRLAHRIVSAVMLFTAVASTPAATAAAPALGSFTPSGSTPPEPVRAVATLLHNTAGATRSATPTRATWTVERGDTLWDIAAACLGDGSRVEELIAANPYLTPSRPLRPGQVIDLPAGTEPPAARTSVGATRASSWMTAAEETNDIASGRAEQRWGVDDRSPAFPGDAPSSSDRSAVGATDNVTADVEMYTVRDGDTLWDIVDDHYGAADGELVWALATVNHLDNPSLIHAGQALTLPALEQLRQTGTGSSVDAPAATPAATVHIVETGDTLSAVAARYLGDPSRYGEIFDATRDRLQPDGRHLTNPDLIVVGWQLVVPTDPATPVSEPTPQPTDTAPAAPIPPTALPPRTDTHQSTSTPPETSDAHPTTSTTSAPSSTPTATTPPPPTTPASPATTTPINVSSEALRPPAGTTHNKQPGSESALLLALAGAATALATGLAIRLRWLRKRRAIRITCDPVPTTDLERTVAAAADEPLVRWAGQQLAAMTRQLDPRRISGGPVAVELSADSGIEVLWETPQTVAPPSGWSAADGGWAWRCRYDADAPVPRNEFPAAIPALVTIGERDGRQLLVDLEAFGILAINGRAEHAIPLAASIAVELACGDDLADTYVTTVGIAIDPAIAAGHRLASADPDQALGVLDGAARSVTDAIADTDTTFLARLGHTTPIEATVIVADQLEPEQVAQLTDRVTPRRGIAVVTTSAVPLDVQAARIEIDADGATARLQPLGVSFRPASLHPGTITAIESAATTLAALPDTDEAAEASQIDAATASTNGHRPHHSLDNAPTHDTDTPSGGPRPVDDRPVDPSTPDQTDDVARGRLFDTPAADTNSPEMVVRVLGVPRIDERPELGRRELILAVLLACRGGVLSATAAQDALWGGKPVEAKTVWNFVTNTRRALGDFNDGTPVMPAADRTRGTLRLDPRVVTDLALLRTAVDIADDRASSEAIQILVEALELVEGPPFDAAGYDWAHRDQDVAEAGRVIQQAVDALVGLALDAGRADLARDAIVRGLRGLPGDEHLYRARLRVEAAAGNHAGVIAAFEELCLYLADFDTQPSPVTTALYHELKRRPAVGSVN